MPLYPVVLWAQKKDCLYLTIELQDSENLKIDLKEDKLYFYGIKDKNEYEFTLNFLKPINVDESKYSTKRNIKFKIIKKEKERWKTINNDGKKHWIKCDWNSWVDTDEEDKVTEFDDMAMNNFGGMPGMPDMSQLGGMDFSKLGGGLGDMGNLEGLGGMDQFKNMPNIDNMNDEDEEDSSSYDDSSEGSSENDEGEESKKNDHIENEENKDICTDNKNAVDKDNNPKIQDPIVEVQEPVA